MIFQMKPSELLKILRTVFFFGWLYHITRIFFLHTNLFDAGMGMLYFVCIAEISIQINGPDND